MLPLSVVLKLLLLICIQRPSAIRGRGKQADQSRLQSCGVIQLSCIMMSNLFRCLRMFMLYCRSVSAGLKADWDGVARVFAAFMCFTACSPKQSDMPTAELGDMVKSEYCNTIFTIANPSQ
ncbi:hypothetical protein MHYP_G00240940 [Metynnis hypsauchen]